MSRRRRGYGRRRYAYVSLDTTDKVAKIDTGTYGVTYIDVTPRIDPLIFRRPGSDRIYVTSYAIDVNVHCGQDSGGDPDLAVYLEQTRKISVIEGDLEIGTIDGLYNGTWPMAFSPDGRYGYVGACNDTNYLWTKFMEIDLDAGAVGEPTRETDLSLWNTYSLEVSPNPLTPYALISFNDGCIASINLTTMTEVDQDPLDADPYTALCGFTGSWGLQFNAIGDRVYIADNGTGSLVTVNSVDPAHLTLVSSTAVINAGSPTNLRIVGTTAYVVGAEGPWDVFPSHVIAFDLTDPDNPAQGCSIAAGNGGFELDVTGVPGPWLCPADGGGGAGDPKKVKGQGHLAASPKVHFEFKAELDKKGHLKGQCNIEDNTSRPHRHFKCTEITGLTVSGNAITITAEGYEQSKPKTPLTLTIMATDNGKPGRGVDTFSVTTSNGYSAGLDTLKDGDVKIYPAKPGHGDDEDDD